ncbi:MAG: hypothetical protein SFU56_01770 [Capsulimonadales bacterium]|nr:hypothetical protein [Capsulimonadales bacterium]
MKDVFLFELRFRTRQISTYLFFGIFFLLALLFISTDIVQLGGGDGRVKGNAPFVISVAGTILMVLGGTICSALLGTAVYRDFEANAHELFFTTRLSKRDYLFGRFLGAFVVTVLVFLSIPLGFILGTVAPWADKSDFGPFRADAYLFFLGVYLLPNLLLVGSFCFVFGALTRSLLAIYVQGILLFVGWAMSLSLLSNLESRELAAFFDPFGLSATSLLTRYWTLAEKNTSLLTLSGPLLVNRAFWLAIAAVVFAIGYRLFAFSRHPLTLARRRKTAIDNATLTESVLPSQLPPAATEPVSPRTVYLRLTGFYYREILRGVPFLAITFAGMLLLFVNASQADRIFDTPIYPVTRVMMDSVANGFSLFFVILITFYTGELVWRERVLRLDQITDALPTSTAAGMLAKVSAIVAMLMTLNVGLIAAGIVTQAAKGYFHFELPLYATYLFGILLPGWIAMVFLAFFLHSVLNNKFLGHTALILISLSASVLPLLKLERYLYRFGSGPTPVYSDMNGFGPFLAPVFWFTLYWLAVSVLLLLAALRLWVRGKEERLFFRWQNGRIGRAGNVVGVTAAATVVGSAAFITYNTDVLHEYVPKQEGLRRQETYERSYKAAWEKKPMPHITAVRLDVDLQPERLRYAVRGTYRLRNKSGRPIREVALQTDQTLTVKELRFAVPVTPDIVDNATGFRTFRLERPLSPGEETTLDFSLAYDKTGFPNDGIQTAIAENGTFVTMPVPAIGYQPGGEITDEREREKRKLPKRPRMPALTDTAARNRTYLGSDADWIDFEATVRTSPDQTAIAPGYLQKEWTENGRRCFRYKMDAPIRNFYSFLSARYAVKRDTWTGQDGKKVALEIWYHPAHAYNLDRMMAGMKDALTYCSENFGPYQFRQLRILEFPAYASFAQSFPNTVPYSEAIGFIARVREEEEDIDYPYYVTAHETAHQWWAHQVLGADMEGATLLSESLAEYSALKILEKKYGPERIRRFLRHDLDRYLRGRGGEREEENPLVKVQNQQYIHYPKGALAFYALADRIAEKRLNAVLARFVRDKGFQEPPYTTSLELLEYLKTATPAGDRTFLGDLFERITMYDCRATEASAKRLPDGKWRVTVTVSASKRYADGSGRETVAPLDDLFDIGVFAAAQGRQRDKDAVGKPLILERHRLTTERRTFTFETETEPAKAGIDPYNKMIDRIPSDNVIKVTTAP